MAKHTIQANTQNTNVYIYEGQKVISGSHFIYEVELYRISKNKAYVFRTRRYKSNKLLNVNEAVVVRKYSTFTIERFITLLQVPEWFIIENNLKLFKNERKKN